MLTDVAASEAQVSALCARLLGRILGAGLGVDVSLSTLEALAAGIAVAWKAASAPARSEASTSNPNYRMPTFSARRANNVRSSNLLPRPASKRN